MIGTSRASLRHRKRQTGSQHKAHRPVDCTRRAMQGGLGLVEVLVAMVIALFLLGGLFTIFFSTRQTYSAQQGLAGLQENERLAMTLVSSVIQNAGYFPTPQPPTPIPNTGTALPAQNAASAPLPTNFTAGQSIFGGTVNGKDAVMVRYVAAPGDGVMSCLGETNPSSATANVTYLNTYMMSGTNLQCASSTAVNGAPTQTQTLVGNNLVGSLQADGVTDMALLYGLDSNNGGSANQYVTAANVTSWLNVKSVKVTLTFTNPLAGQPGQPGTIRFTRVIDILGQL